MQSSSVLSLSPSFTTCSSTRLADIAARVVDEFPDENFDGDFEDNFNFYEELKIEKDEEEKMIQKVENYEEKDDDDDGEFEFAFVAKDFIPSPTPADEIFYNGQIRPIYPVFDTTLLFDGVEKTETEKEKFMQKPPPAPASNRLPLRKLFLEDREIPPSSSCSSSEADELDGVTPGTYCVWNPKATGNEAPAADVRCKKSNSTGSSKRWRFRDLLNRSSSDGKDSFVFFTHSNSVSEKNGEEKAEKSGNIAAAVSAKGGDKVTAAQWGKNSGDRRKASYLPYRQDLVGIFSNVNGLMSRSLHPF